MDLLERLSLKDHEVTILDAIGDGVIVTDLDEKICYMNGVAQQLTGWATTDACGRLFDEVLPIIRLDTGETMPSPVRSVLESGQTTGLTHHAALITQKGEKCYTSATCSPLYSQGDIKGAVVVFRTIDRIMRAEEELRQERNNLKMLFDQSPMGMLLIDQDAAVINYNQTVRDMLDQEGTDQSHCRFGDLLHCINSLTAGCGNGIGCADCTLRNTIKAVIQSGEPVRDMLLEYPRVHEGQTIKPWYKVSFVPVTFYDQPHVMVVIDDVTKEKQQQDQLRQAKNSYVKMMDEFPSMIYRMDVNGHCDYLNHTWLSFTGMTMEEGLGQGWHKSIPPQDLKRVGAIFWEAQKERAPFKMEFLLRRNDGIYCTVLSMGTPYYDLENTFSGYLGTVYDLTDKMEAEESRARYELLSQKARDVILFIEEDGTVVEANEAAVSTYGYSREELRGMNIRQIRKSWALTHELKEKIYSSGISFEAVHYRKDGSSFVAEVSCRGSLIGSKRILFCVIRDITERLNAQRRLLESEERFRLLFNNATDAIYLYELPDGDLTAGSLIEVNDVACRLLGYKREELLAKTPLDLDDETSRKNIPQVLSKVREIGHYTFESVHVAKNGRRIPVEINTHYFKLKGKPVVLSMARDITERKKAERMLQESEQRYHSLFMNMTSGFAYHKAILGEGGEVVDFEFILVNHAYEGMFGVTQDHIAGKRYSEVFPWDTHIISDNTTAFRKIVEEGHTVVFDEIYLEAFGKWYTIAMYSPQKGYLAAIFTDVDEKKKATLEIRVARDQAESANRAKSDFLANMSHEIRTPINGIIGMIELTMMTSLDSEQKENLETAKSCANSLHHIINDILDFSKMEAGKLIIYPTDFDMHQLLETIVKAHSVRAEAKDITLSLSCDTTLPRFVVSDPNRLEQVLNNLLSNAIKFTDRGSVTLSVNLSESDGGQKKILFSVSDTGIGISPDGMEKLFKSFSQLDGTYTRKHGGTGLGLVISKQLVERMEGRMWVESMEGVGSTFSFSLPFKEGHKPMEKLQASVAEQKPMNISVLMVEDDQVNQMVLCRMLKEKGILVDIAGNGIEALECHANKTYDLIFMDIQMPLMDGLEATKRIREREGDLRHTPIVALTAFALFSDRDKFLSAGMDEYLAKPILMEDLFRTIEEMTGKGGQESEIYASLRGEESLQTVPKTDKHQAELKALILQAEDRLIELTRSLIQEKLTEAETFAHRLKEQFERIEAGDLRLGAFAIELAVRRGNLKEAMEATERLNQAFYLYKNEEGLP